MEKILQYTFFYKLNTTSDKHPILITDDPLNTKENREKITEIMFETLNVPAFFMKIPAVLALYSTGRDTGLVLESGDSVTHIISIYQGNSLPKTSEKINLGGRDVTNNLLRLLNEKNYPFTNTINREFAIEIKEKLCYVASNFSEEMQKLNDNNIAKEYNLPDGNQLIIETERFLAPEILFQPKLFGYDFNGIGEAIYKSLLNSDDCIRKILACNFVISGGNTILKEFEGRILNELLSKKNPPIKRIMTVISPVRNINAWIGGSIFSMISIFEQTCMY